MSHPVIRKQKNPLDFAISKLGMTRATFGARHDLGKSYLLRLSQGRHSQIGQFTLNALYSEAESRGVNLDKEVKREYGAKTLAKAWDDWVSSHRKLQTLPEPVSDRNINPFARLVRAAGGVSRMAALLAVPDPLVERYYKGTTYRMPVPIRDALEELKYPYTAALDAAMRAWGK